MSNKSEAEKNNKIVDADKSNSQNLPNGNNLAQNEKSENQETKFKEELDLFLNE